MKTAVVILFIAVVTTITLAVLILQGIASIIQTYRERDRLKEQVRALRVEMCDDAIRYKSSLESAEAWAEDYKRKAARAEWRSNTYESAYRERVEKLERELKVARELLRQKDASDQRMAAEVEA